MIALSTLFPYLRHFNLKYGTEKNRPRADAGATRGRDTNWSRFNETDDLYLSFQYQAFLHPALANRFRVDDAGQYCHHVFVG
jgi:hypothetical protein